MRFFLALCLTSLLPQTCFAWFEGGHHLIAVMAYELLSEQEQQKIQQILESHPRFKEDFAAPANVVGPAETKLWVIGRAGYWPDVARAFPEWTRPTWHYQLGATLTVGNVEPPKTPGPVPSNADLNSQDLYVAQAIELCRKVLGDESRPASDRALAICWLAHLVADSHQPCHSGSLYVAKLFPEGDRGANLITLKSSQSSQAQQIKTLHLHWDNLLGSVFDPAELRRRALDIKSDKTLWSKASDAATKPNGLSPLTWLAESNEYARSHVYAPEVLDTVTAAQRSGSTTVEIAELSEEYVQAGEKLSRVRAAYAATRLSAILHERLSAKAR